MILYNSPSIRLNYSPTTDILIADLSATYEFYALEVQEALTTIARYIRHYDIKKLLIDSRNRIVQMDNDQYTAAMTTFMRELEATRLQKLARLNTNHTNREHLARTMQEQVITKFQMRTFNEPEQALAWLEDK